MVFMIESQLNYLVDWLKTVRRNDITRTEVRADVQREYNREVQSTLETSVWENGGCSSWYKDKFGNITTLWPGFTFNYRKATKKFDLPAYETRRGDASTPASESQPATASV